MTGQCKTIITYGSLLGWLVIGTACAWAQPAAGQSDQDVLLAEFYQDDATGVRFRPPRGAVPIADQPTDTKAGVLVAAFEQRSRQWSLQVRRRSPSASRSCQEILKELRREMIREHPTAKVSPIQARMVGDRPGGWFTARYQVLERPWFAHHGVIEQQPGNLLHLILTGLSTPDHVEDRVFDAVLDSVTFLRSAEAERILYEATQRGREWLDSLKGESLADVLVPDAVYLLTVEPEQPDPGAPGPVEVGFVRVQEWRPSDTEPRAIRLLEEGWRFEPNGTVMWWKRLFTLNEDLGRERWEITTVTAIAPTDAAPLQLASYVERALRVEDTLAISFTPTPDGLTLSSMSLNLPGTFLSPTLTRLLPRLIDRSEPQRLAFTVYDSACRKLLPYSLVLLGPEEQTLGGQVKDALRFEEQTGLGQATVFWTDADSRPLGFQAGTLRSTPSTLQYVEKVFSERVAAAGRMMGDIQAAAQRAARGP